MHTFHYWDESFEPCDCVYIHHNGDYSGEVEIVMHKSIDTRVKIPCEALLRFAAEHVRMQRISELEQMEWQDLLKQKEYEMDFHL